MNSVGSALVNINNEICGVMNEIKCNQYKMGKLHEIIKKVNEIRTEVNDKLTNRAFINEANSVMGYTYENTENDEDIETTFELIRSYIEDLSLSVELLLQKATRLKHERVCHVNTDNTFNI